MSFQHKLSYSFITFMPYISISSRSCSEFTNPHFFQKQLCIIATNSSHPSTMVTMELINPITTIILLITLNKKLALILPLLPALYNPAHCKISTGNQTIQRIPSPKHVIGLKIPFLSCSIALSRFPI